MLLLVALGVTGIVTYRAYVASREHRAIVERVVNDYVAVASYQIGNSTRIALDACLRYWLGDAADRSRPDDMRLDGCALASKARFDMDLVNGGARTWDGAISTPLVSWLRDTIPQHPTIPYSEHWDFGILGTRNRAEQNLVVFAVERRSGRTVRAIGFLAPSPVPAIVREVVAASRMLPPELTRGLPDSLYFSVHTNMAGKRRDASWGRSISLGPEFGEIPLNVSLKEAALDRIVAGGMPHDRGLELIGLFALTTVLVASSLMLLRKEAQLSRLRTGFVSSVSHELRTPLAQIRMFAEMLLLGRVRNDADQRRSLEIIDKEARRLTQLVENVLQVARSEHGAVRVHPTDAAVAPVIRDVAESFVLMAEARNIELRLELQENLIAPIDGAAIRQILLNLLDNAVKYGPRGQRVVVGLALFENVARLWVDDEGPGVPARERERVFEAFYRARRDMDSHATGTGIGLAVVRELAVLHGGSCRIEDAPQNGARVVVEFPGAYVAADRSAGDSAVA